MGIPLLIFAFFLRWRQFCVYFSAIIIIIRFLSFRGFCVFVIAGARKTIDGHQNSLLPQSAKVLQSDCIFMNACGRFLVVRRHFPAAEKLFIRVEVAGEDERSPDDARRVNLVQDQNRLWDFEPKLRTCTIIVRMIGHSRVSLVLAVLRMLMKRCVLMKITKRTHT